MGKQEQEYREKKVLDKSSPRVVERKVQPKDGNINRKKEVAGMEEGNPGNYDGFQLEKPI
jgi:hypothetical protein